MGPSGEQSGPSLSSWSWSSDEQPESERTAYLYNVASTGSPAQLASTWDKEAMWPCGQEGGLNSTLPESVLVALFISCATWGELLTLSEIQFLPVHKRNLSPD